MFCTCKTTPPKLTLYRGNTLKGWKPELKFNNEDKITLLSGELLLFIVKTDLGTTCLSKTLIGKEDENVEIAFDFNIEDTINLRAPYVYNYSIDLYVKGENAEEQMYTLQKGLFQLEEPYGDVNDIETE